MTEEQADRLINAVIGHGDTIGGNLVLLKKFLAAQREEQQAFLAKLQQDQQAFLAAQREAS